MHINNMKNVIIILLIAVAISAKPKYRAGFFLIEDPMNFMMSVVPKTNIEDVKKKIENEISADTTSYRYCQGRIDSVNMIFFNMRANNDPDTVGVKLILDSLWGIYDSLFEKSMNDSKIRREKQSEQAKTLYIKAMREKAESLDLDLIYEKSSGKIFFIREGENPEKFTDSNTETVDITEEIKKLLSTLFNTDL